MINPGYYNKTSSGRNISLGLPAKMDKTLLFMCTADRNSRVSIFKSAKSDAIIDDNPLNQQQINFHSYLLCLFLNYRRLYKH